MPDWSDPLEIAREAGERFLCFGCYVADTFLVLPIHIIPHFSSIIIFPSNAVWVALVYLRDIPKTLPCDVRVIHVGADRSASVRLEHHLARGLFRADEHTTSSDDTLQQRAPSPACARNSAKRIGP